MKSAPGRSVDRLLNNTFYSIHNDTTAPPASVYHEVKCIHMKRSTRYEMLNMYYIIYSVSQYVQTQCFLPRDRHVQAQGVFLKYTLQMPLCPPLVRLWRLYINTQDPIHRALPHAFPDHRWYLPPS